LLPYFAAGLSLGIAAGVSPGPLLALVVSQTLQHGWREGVKVACAPLVSDIPIVALSLFVLSRFSNAGPVLGWISIAGGLFVGYLGYELLRAGAFEVGETAAAPRSFRKAVLVNLLNPSVYVFWATVGSPMILRGLEKQAAASLAFAGGFYGCLVGSKIVLAFLVSGSRGLLKGRGYRITVRILGVLLLGLGAWLVLDGAMSLSA